MTQVLEKIFNNLNINKDDIEAMANASRVQTYKKGERLISNNDCSGFIIVFYGKFRAYIISPNAKEITLFTLNSDESCVICSNCVFNSLSLNILLESVEPTKILLIPQNIFNEMKQKYPALNDFVLNLVAKRFTQSLSVMENALFTPLVDRIRELLKQNAKNDIVKLTHEAIANELGSAREAVSRILKEMEKNNEIKLQRGEIKLIQLNA